MLWDEHFSRIQNKVLLMDEYTNCGGDAIVQYGNEVCMMFACTARVTPVSWQQKVVFLEVMVVMVLTPSLLTHCPRPPSEPVQGGVQQLFIVELIPMETYAEGKVYGVVSQQLVMQEWHS